KGMAGDARSGTSQPVQAVAGWASAGLAVKPAVHDLQEGAKAFKRDYEEPTRPVETGEATGAEDREAEEARKLDASRRAQAVMMGYTGNSCPECQNFTMVRNG